VTGKIKVTYTIEEFLDIDIPDDQEYDEDLELKADAIAQDFVPTRADDWQWEWAKKPRAKSKPLQPPDELYFETSIGPCATNGHLLIKKGFVLPDGVGLSTYWRKVADNTDRIEKVLSVDWQSLSPTREWFDLRYLPLKVMGLNVVGDSLTAYLVKDGELVGVLMVAHNGKYHPEKFFQFNEGESK
jgi:hypothetical protein